MFIHIQLVEINLCQNCIGKYISTHISKIFQIFVVSNIYFFYLNKIRTILKH